MSAATDGGEHDQRDVDRRAASRGCAGAGGGDDEQADQLDRRHADVAAAGVEPERPALLPLRVEGVDVRHRRGEVAAADPGRRPRPTRTPVGRAGLETTAASDRRDRAAAARERSSSCARRTAPPRTCRAAAAPRRPASGTRRSRNLPAASTPYSGPMNSTRTDHMVQTEKPTCSDRIENDEVAVGDPRARALPERGVLRPPVVDPAGPAGHPGGCGGVERRRHGSSASGCGGDARNGGLRRVTAQVPRRSRCPHRTGAAAVRPGSVTARGRAGSRA